MKSAAGCRLYVITPPALDPAAFAPRLAAALDAGDVAAVQLRLKEVDDDVLRRAIDALRPVVQSRDVAFILNDRPDLAAATGCDGVHVGRDDTPYTEARRLVGDDAIVGVSAYASYDRAMRLAEAGADYVAFGSFFASTTKDAPERADLALLETWSQIMVVPSCAIGGITPANCGPLVRAGADFLCAISAIWDHPAGPGAAVRAFAQAIREAERPRED